MTKILKMKAYSTTQKVNAIARQVMLAANADQEDHALTVRLLEELERAIQESHFSKKAG